MVSVVKMPVPESRSMRALLEPPDVGAPVVASTPRPTPRRTAGRPRPARGAGVRRASSSSSWASAQPVGVHQDPHDRAARPRRRAARPARGRAWAPRRRASARRCARSPATAGRRSTRAPASSGATAPSAGDDSAKHVGHCRLQWSSDVLEQDAGVLGLHLGQPLRIGRRHRQEVAAHVGLVRLGGGRPLLEVAEDLGRLVVEGTHQPVLGAAALEPHPVVAHDEPARRGAARPRAGGPARSSWQVRAEGDDVAVHAVAPQRHPGSMRRPPGARGVGWGRPRGPGPGHAVAGAARRAARTIGTVTARNSCGRVRPCHTTSLPRTNSTRKRKTP